MNEVEYYLRMNFSLASRSKPVNILQRIVDDWHVVNHNKRNEFYEVINRKINDGDTYCIEKLARMEPTFIFCNHELDNSIKILYTQFKRGRYHLEVAADNCGFTYDIMKFIMTTICDYDVNDIKLDVFVDKHIVDDNGCKIEIQPVVYADTNVFQSIDTIGEYINNLRYEYLGHHLLVKWM